MTEDPYPSPLGRILAEQIERDGPISVHDFMDACLHHPKHGYYRTRVAIGAQEDFITAPEISQVFGELIGLWSAVVWQQMGSPSRVRLVEVGPGRGTLMRDALRAARAVPAFRAALDVQLVDANDALQAVQRKTLDGCGVPIHWCADLAELAPTADGIATIVIANEFLDVIPITQLVLTDGGWAERAVDVNARGRLIFSHLGLVDECPKGALAAKIGSVVERRDLGSLMRDFRRLSDAGPFAGLFIDYGFEGPALGDTLQAIRKQEFYDPLVIPGLVDLTAHVDFAAFADDARAVGLTIDGPRDQGAFLGALGIVERTSRLMSANPQSAGSLEMGTARLISPTGMGSRFKAIGVRGPDVGPLPGLSSALPLE